MTFVVSTRKLEQLPQWVKVSELASQASMIHALSATRSD